ncbi:MAG: hypothetical protein R6X02_21225 [Enhygromyxa sp.]
MLGVRSRILFSLALLFTFACGPEKHDQAANAKVSPGLGPRATVSEPAQAEPEAEPVAPEPEPESAPELEPEPELDDRKLALANVGRGAFDALQAGDFAAFSELTPLDEGPLRDLCPRMPASDRRELEARFEHCHQTIDWGAVAEAQVFAGTPSGAKAIGCDSGIEDYGRLQLFLHMNDKKIWRVDFFGAVGQDGNVVGINGEVSCKQVDEAPPLK